MNTLAIVVTLLFALALLPSGSASAQTDPGSLPIPLPGLDLSSKAVVVDLDFTGDTNTQMVSADVVFGRAAGKAGNPPLVRVELVDYRGQFLTGFDEWDPRWVFSEGASGGESLNVVPQAPGRFLIPFESDLQTIEVFNLREDQEVGSFDLGPAIREFCETNPSDPDCEVADLQVVSAQVTDPPPLVVIGQPEMMTLHVVITNAGPDAPIDVGLEVTATAGAGLSIGPTPVTHEELGLGLGELRERDQAYSVSCLEPGLHTVTFNVSVDTLKPAVSDPVPANNELETGLEIDCAVPVTINIKPRSLPNSINRRSRAAIPVSVLTTDAGEYGNPLAFDATSIDPQSAGLGPRTLAAGGGGAAEAHSRGHIEDSVELDEKTRDGDSDMVLHFRTPDASFAATDTEGCVKGSFDAGGGMSFTFFGCDSVRIVN
jgi:hypothetical protein